MLTVDSALNLAPFSQAKLVAGHNGVHHAIRWVHIVDIPDARYEVKRSGVLLLTAGYGLMDSLKRQQALIPRLVSNGFAGLVFSTGYYFDETPEAIRNSANEHNFPIIEIPKDQAFIEITEAILQRIVNEQAELLEKSQEINQTLTRIVLEGATVDDLANTLARLLDRSITIESSNFELLAAAQQGPIDAARQHSIEHGRTSREVSQHLLKIGVYEQLRTTMTTVRVPPIPEFGLSMERFVAPIIVNRAVYGYIWIIAGDSPLTDLHELAIRHAAMVTALIMFKEEAVRQAEQSTHGDFIDQLVRGETETDSFRELARQLGFKTNQPHQAWLLSAEPGIGRISNALTQRVTNWLRTQQIEFQYIARENVLLLIVAVGRIERGRLLSQQLLEEVAHPVQKLWIAIGRIASNAARIQQSYHDANECLTIMLSSKFAAGVYSFHDLGLLHWLYHLPAEQREGNHYYHAVSKLVAYDKQRKTTLFETLEQYLRHGGGLAEASRQLFIHRNTLLHRIERIETLIELDLRDSLHRMNLFAAVQAHKLFT